MSKQDSISVFDAATAQAREMAGAVRIDGDGTTLYEYPDYDTYRAVQIAGNKAKITAQYVPKSHIFALGIYLRETLPGIGFGICHGTRSGREQTWFRRKLPGPPEVIGTEISDTAGQFPLTVQWDFHDENPEWEGRADFVYSNSWDHAYDPGRAFRAWAKSLKPGGLMLLDHTAGQTPEATNPLDPFGATWGALQRILVQELDGLGELLFPIDRTMHRNYPARVSVWRRGG